MTIIMYHSKCFKYDNSNKKLYTMFVSIMCNMQACDIFRELSDRTNGEISKFTLLFNYMVHVLHKMPYDRRKKAYRLPQMIKRLFQHSLLLSSVAG